MPRAIVFDLFGVIALQQSPAAKRRIERLAGADPEEFWAAYWALRKPYDAGQPSAAYWAAVGERLGVRFEPGTVAALVDADMASWTEVDPKHERWLTHFTALTYSCAIGVAKPDRRAYEIAAERLGVATADCLFIDDSEANVRAAREAGMRAEVFRSPEQVRRLLGCPAG